MCSRSPFPCGGGEFLPVGFEHFSKDVRGGEDHFGNRLRFLFHQLRRKHIFEIVRELAQLAKAASRGVALQRVHRAANVAKLLGVAGSSSSASPASIHALKKFLRALKKEVAKFRRRWSIGRKNSPRRLSILLVNRGVVLMDHANLS